MRDELEKTTEGGEKGADVLMAVDDRWNAS